MEIKQRRERRAQQIFGIILVNQILFLIAFSAVRENYFWVVLFLLLDAWLLFALLRKLGQLDASQASLSASSVWCASEDLAPMIMHEMAGLIHPIRFCCTTLVDEPNHPKLTEYLKTIKDATEQLTRVIKAVRNYMQGAGVASAQSMFGLAEENARVIAQTQRLGKKFRLVRFDVEEELQQQLVGFPMSQTMYALITVYVELFTLLADGPTPQSIQWKRAEESGACTLLIHPHAGESRMKQLAQALSQRLDGNVRVSAGNQIPAGLLIQWPLPAATIH